MHSGGGLGGIYMREIPLSLLSRGEKGTVYSITGGQNMSKRLQEMGLNKGVELEVIKNDLGPVIVCREGAKIALGRGLAQKILLSI